MDKLTVTQEFLDEHPELAKEHGVKVGEEVTFTESGDPVPIDPRKG